MSIKASKTYIDVGVQVNGHPDTDTIDRPLSKAQKNNAQPKGNPQNIGVFVSWHPNTETVGNLKKE